MQNSLFNITPQFPEGFYYFPEFISSEEERILCNTISSLTLKTFTFRGYVAKRKVASYGYDYHFDNRTISKGEPIPIGFVPLMQRVAIHLKLLPSDFAELLVSSYSPGTVINWHRDAPPFDLIAGISLLSDCKFKLRPYKQATRNKNSVITIPVKRLSMYVLSGDARDNWEHSIAPVTGLRYSITLRTLRTGFRN
jgi:alkylated DNA repair dioxygenase AlkB